MDDCKVSDEGLGDDVLPVVVVVDQDDVLNDVCDVLNGVRDYNRDDDDDVEHDRFERQPLESESCSEGEAESGTTGASVKSGSRSKREKDAESPKDQGLVSLNLERPICLWF